MNIQTQHRQNLWTIIEREYDSSRMNTSLWMAMFEDLKELHLWHRIKLITTPQASDWMRSISIGSALTGMPRGYFEDPWSPTLLLEIEWVEFDPIADRDKQDYSEEIERRLQSATVPYTWEGHLIRITGHVRRTMATQII